MIVWNGVLGSMRKGRVHFLNSDKEVFVNSMHAR